MKLLLFSFYFLIISCSSSPTRQPSSTAWGEKITEKHAKDINELLASNTQNVKSEILVKAKVGKVCEKKGCWMTLETQSKDIRVTFKDYGFFVPITLVGKTILAQGNLSTYKMDLAEAKHMAEDAGKDPNEISAPIKEYRFVASGIKRLD